MKLRRPTDFLILEALTEHGRNVATNLAHHTGKSRKNVNTRMPVLADYELVRKIGPAEHSGLYEVTDTGRVALQHRDSYDDVEDFAELVRSRELTDDTITMSDAAEAETDTNGRCSQEKYSSR
jgi:hypothetical protein